MNMKLTYLTYNCTASGTPDYAITAENKSFQPPNFYLNSLFIS